MKSTKAKGPKAVRGSKPTKPEADPRQAIDPEMLKDVGGLIEDPERWFRTPNVIFELRAPIELLGTPEESRIRERIEAAKLGFFT
jgi:energy-coupling factor transporter ATP-binding protein EcfA2